MENKNGLCEIQRTIASAVIISNDRKFLFGQKDPEKGGVYPTAWHILGGKEFMIEEGYIKAEEGK